MIVLFNFVYRKMRPPICVLMSILLMITDGFTVHGPSGPLVAPLGSSLVLPCYIDEVLLPMEGLEVEWRRTDSETLVHLYQDGESRPEAQQQEYHDRAHFFTDQIQHGNFSLRLDNLRAEDEGKYTCKVYSQQDSGETVVTLKSAERLQVSGSSRSMSASVGEDVTLNCSVDSHITPEHIEEVSWKKTDEDILVLLYQNNETIPDSSDERYRDRVEFFTDEIPKGNFSLRLKSVRTEDKGVYMCQVFAGGLSANATAVLERLGLSVSHIMVLILCIFASGSALLLCFIIYCRSHNEVLRVQVLLVFCPNMILFFAFILWGFAEGSLHETVSCCILYFTRPLMLFWAAPYLKDFPDMVRRWIDSSSIDTRERPRGSGGVAAVRRGPEPAAVRHEGEEQGMGDSLPAALSRRSHRRPPGGGGGSSRPPNVQYHRMAPRGRASRLAEDRAAVCQGTGPRFFFFSFFPLSSVTPCASVSFSLVSSVLTPRCCGHRVWPPGGVERSLGSTPRPARGDGGM